MAVQQRACGHLVPASFARCPTCGALIGTAGPPGPTPGARVSRSVILIMIIGIVALVGLMAVAASLVMDARSDDPPRSEGSSVFVAVGGAR